MSKCKVAQRTAGGHKLGADFGNIYPGSTKYILSKAVLFHCLDMLFPGIWLGIHQESTHGCSKVVHKMFAGDIRSNMCRFPRLSLPPGQWNNPGRV